MTGNRPDSNIHFILVGTTHAGNIGAAARAMKTMGFDSLRLVQPCRYLTQEAHVRASGAGEILENASVYTTLADALSDCICVFGTSARSRSLEGQVQSARQAASSIAGDCSTSPAGAVAVVFGRERSGLSNEELALCDRRLCIPGNTEFSSLNLGSAVQVVAYELRQALQAGSDNSGNNTGQQLDPAAELADNQAMQRFYQHLEQALVELEFLDPQNPRLLMPRLRRYFNRNRPEQSELNILRGILTAAQKARADKTDPNPANPVKISH